jgi:fermentation-respiration switch protein FrsA (DUF1100 family)
MRSTLVGRARGLGWSLLAFEYPGYGASEGTPSEDAVNDAMYNTVYFVRNVLGYPYSRIILFGRSIGTGSVIDVAAHLCDNETPPAAVVTLSAYKSIKDVVKHVAGYIAGGIVLNRWNNIKLIQRVSSPTLLIHGELDELIPPVHSRSLKDESCAEHCQLHIVPSADHNMGFCEYADIIQPIRDFIAKVHSMGEFEPPGASSNIDFDAPDQVKSAPRPEGTGWLSSTFMASRTLTRSVAQASVSLAAASAEASTAHFKASTDD